MALEDHRIGRTRRPVVLIVEVGLHPERLRLIDGGGAVVHERLGEVLGDQAVARVVDEPADALRVHLADLPARLLLGQLVVDEPEGREAELIPRIDKLAAQTVDGHSLGLPFAGWEYLQCWSHSSKCLRPPPDKSPRAQVISAIVATSHSPSISRIPSTTEFAPARMLTVAVSPCCCTSPTVTSPVIIPAIAWSCPARSSCSFSTIRFRWLCGMLSQSGFSRRAYVS